MTSWLRVALAALLSLAVTLHVNAGAMILGCAPAPWPDTSQHEHRAQAAADPHRVAAHSGHVAAHDDPASGHAAHSKSGACSACCIAAMPGCASSMPSAPAADDFSVLESPTSPVFLTDGPERPPRHLGA